jgi:DNA-binding GntR family transcriptional regulator
MSRSLARVQTVTKTDAAYRAMRLAIEDGSLQAGERLTVNALQEWLGMSPTPIREALRLLQADGVVKHTPHHGMVVTEFSPESILEVYRVRAELESLATGWAAQQATDVHVNQLRRTHQRFAAAVHQNPAGSEVAALNASWHATIYDAAGSPHLREFIERLWSNGGGKAMWISARAEEAVESHSQILAAIEERDAELAADLMRKHIEGGAAAHKTRLRQLGYAIPDESSGGIAVVP